MSDKINTHELAKTGFLMIRKLLQGRLSGGPTAALQLAEAFHSLPESESEFLEELVSQKLNQLIAKYPEFRDHLERFTQQD